MLNFLNVNVSSKRAQIKVKILLSDQLGRDSQNFLRQICKFFGTLGLNNLRFLRLKVVSMADIMKGWC